MASTQNLSTSPGREGRLFDATLYALVAYSLFFFLTSVFEIAPARLAGVPQLFFLVASATIIWWSKKPPAWFGLHRKAFFKELGIGLLAAIVPIAVALVVALLAGFKPDDWQRFVQQSLESRQAAHLFVLVILAPFAEELFFRGLLARVMVGRTKPVWIVLFVSTVFMVAHFSFKIGPFLLGLATTSMFLWRRSLVSCVVLHAICNALGPLLIFFAPNAFHKLRIFFL